MPGRAYTYDHRVTAAGGAGLERRLRSADRNRRGGSNYTRSHTPTHTPTHMQLHGSPRSPAHFLLQLSKETTGEKFTGRKEVETSSQETSSFKSKRERKKKKIVAPTQVKEKQQRLTFFWRPQEAREEVPAGAGPGSVVPWLGPAAGRPSRLAPAGSMNESAWK